MDTGHGILIFLLAGAVIFAFFQHIIIDDYEVENKLLRDAMDREQSPSDVIFSSNTIHNEFLATFKDDLKD